MSIDGRLLESFGSLGRKYAFSAQFPLQFLSASIAGRPRSLFRPKMWLLRSCRLILGLQDNLVSPGECMWLLCQCRWKGRACGTICTSLLVSLAVSIQRLVNHD